MSYDFKMLFHELRTFFSGPKEMDYYTIWYLIY